MDTVQYNINDSKQSLESFVMYHNLFVMYHDMCIKIASVCKAHMRIAE